MRATEAARARYTKALGERGAPNRGSACDTVEFLQQRERFLASQVWGGRACAQADGDGDGDGDGVENGHRAQPVAGWVKEEALKIRLTTALARVATGGTGGALASELVARQRLPGHLALQLIARGKPFLPLRLPVFLVEPLAPVGHQVYIDVLPHTDGRIVLQWQDDVAFCEDPVGQGLRRRPLTCGVGLTLRREDLDDAGVRERLEAFLASPQRAWDGLWDGFKALRAILPAHATPACCEPVWASALEGNNCVVKNHNRGLRSALQHALGAGDEAYAAWRAFKAEERAAGVDL